MKDTASWVGVLIGVLALIVAYVTYRSQRGKSRLEYAVISNASVVPTRVSPSLEVTYAGSVVTDASVAIIRIVNTGDKAIRAEDFSSGLTIQLEGAKELVTASATAARPHDLSPAMHLEGNEVTIAPLLINPGDMIELQLLASGFASHIKAKGRITNISSVNQRNLPYPPGTGEEGELLGFDKFIWIVMGPACLVPIIFLVTGSHMTVPAKTLTLFAIASLGLVVYPLQVRYLIRRRAMWRP